MRVLQAPSNIANQAWMNAEALRRQGHEAEVWQYGPAKFGYPCDREFLGTASGPEVVRMLVEAVEREFDVVHFHFARSLVPQVAGLPWLWDLPLWRALGVRVVFSFHGSDIRRRSIAVQTDEWSAYHFADVPVDEAQVEDVLAIIRSFADVCTISNEANRPYVPEAVYLPLSVDVSAIPTTPRPGRAVPVVAHSPSARGAKGTEFVLDGFEELRRRGVAFEVDLIEGVSNAEVLRRYAQADVVVEKLVNEGFGVAALEAMAVGRPVVSRVVPTVYRTHPDLPIVAADPSTFVDTVAHLLADQARMTELGARGRSYVEQTHDLPHTGRRLEELYTRRTTTPELHYPGWTAPNRDRRVAELQTRLHAAREEAAVARRRVEDLSHRVGDLEAEVRQLRAHGERRAQLARRLARRAARAARALHPRS